MERIVLGGVDGIGARDRIIKGADYVADMVKATLGPGGTNVLMEKHNRVTNDGVSIASEIYLEDEVENMGAQKIKEIATRTNDEAGDGTTTAVTLGQAIYRACAPHMQKEGEFKTKMAPMALVKQIETERDEIIKLLNAKAEKIEDEQSLIDVATVSVEDPELGKLIGSTQWELGPDGHITVEETQKVETSIERVPGIRIDNGFASALLINNPEKGILELRDVSVLITNHTIRDLNPLQILLEQLISRGATQLVLIARGFTDEAVAKCLQNINTPNGFQIYPVNAPFVDQVQVMYDMQAALGGRFINSEESELGSINLTDVAFASLVRCERFSSVFVGRDETKPARDKRAAVLRKKLESELSDFEKRDLHRRISQLENGLALLKVGGLSETDRRYKKDKADDAVNAVRAALEEGVIIGGGVALKEIADELPDTYILKRAIDVPYNQIQLNAGGNLTIEPWVKDPVKVIRTAFEKACSIASVFATTQGVIVSKKQKYNAYVKGTTD